MYCSNCGKELKENAKFCQCCGQAVGDNPSDIEVVSDSRREERNRIQIALLLLLGLAGIGVLFAWGVGKPRKQETTIETQSEWNATEELPISFGENYMGMPLSQMENIPGVMLEEYTDVFYDFEGFVFSDRELSCGGRMGIDPINGLTVLNIQFNTEGEENYYTKIEDKLNADWTNFINRTDGEMRYGWWRKGELHAFLEWDMETCWGNLIYMDIGEIENCASEEIVSWIGDEFFDYIDMVLDGDIIKVKANEIECPYTIEEMHNFNSLEFASYCVYIKNIVVTYDFIEILDRVYGKIKPEEGLRLDYDDCILIFFQEYDSWGAGYQMTYFDKNGQFLFVEDYTAILEEKYREDIRDFVVGVWNVEREIARQFKIGENIYYMVKVEESDVVYDYLCIDEEEYLNRLYHGIGIFPEYGWDNREEFSELYGFLL